MNKRTKLKKNSRKSIKIVNKLKINFIKTIIKQIQPMKNGMPKRKNNNEE